MRIGAKWHPLPTHRRGWEGVPLSPAMAAAAAASGGGLVVGVEKREGIGSAYVIARNIGVVAARSEVIRLNNNRLRHVAEVDGALATAAFCHYRWSVLSSFAASC